MLLYMFPFVLFRILTYNELHSGVGGNVGDNDGANDGVADGETVGDIVGSEVGSIVGSIVGADVSPNSCNNILSVHDKININWKVIIGNDALSME